MNEAKELVNWQRIGYELQLWETPTGYLLTWGDYVANSWAQGFEKLSEALELMAQIEKDANE